MIYLYGAGGHAKVVVDILESCGKTIAGIFDDDPAKSIWSFPNLKFPALFDFSADDLILSIGNNFIRKKIAMKIEVNYHTAIHTSSIISPHSFVDKGTVVMSGTLINADAHIGKHCIINTSASIDHDCVLKDFVHISPNATLCGNVFIGECTHVGAGAIIIPGKKLALMLL